MPHPLRLLPVLLLAGLAAACGTKPAGGSDSGTDGASSEAVAAFERARDRILPAASERRWEEIEWLPSYAVGLRAASTQRRPLMLWVMNGHPLGCT